MKRKRKITVLSLLLLLCVVFGSVSVSAADDRLGEIVDGSVLTDDAESTGMYQAVARWSYLSCGTGTISHTGTKVSVAGTTSCFVTCDKVKVAVYLQRLVGNSWVNVYTLGPKTATNTYYVSNSTSYTVTGGYYYRVSGSHVAIKDGSSEATASCTNGVWVE